MYWYMMNDNPEQLYNKIIQDLEGHTIDEVMDALEEMAVKYSKTDDTDKAPVNNNDISDCDSDCENCEFNEQYPVEFDVHVHDPFIDMITDYLDDTSEDKHDAYDKDEHDAVNHPSYYCGNIEVIDFIEDKNLGYHLGNAVKYISRAGKKHEDGMSNKDKMIQDLRKAVWYINRKIEILKNE